MTGPSNTRSIIDRYLQSLGANAPSQEIAGFFAPDSDYDVPGDKIAAWWVGRRNGRDDIARFYDEMREALEPEDFTVETVLADGADGVVVGHFSSRVRRTGRMIRSPFVMRFVVKEGLIVRYLFLEDSAAARAAALSDG